MNVETVVVGALQVNCYICWHPDSRNSVIIDPGSDEKKIAAELSRLNLTPRAILLTHAHADHIGAVNPLRERYQIPVLAGDGEQKLLSNPNANMSTFLDAPIVVEPPIRWLEDEELVVIEELTFKVLATPGHSPGGVCFLDETSGIAFVGDTLFYGSIGRTDFPGCSHETLIDSINQKLLKLPDNIVCYPGHGPRTTIGAERVNNPFLKGNYFV
ncbi:MAG TPA: MBL fold metallo-hydrolase [candidate division Zixibacteria bacterium]|nr:MBL fold metallo-hydrolase [candidate division Zixibacteria bacterium]